MRRIRGVAVALSILVAAGCSDGTPDWELACGHLADWARELGDGHDDDKLETSIEAAARAADRAAAGDASFERFALAVSRMNRDGWGHRDDKGVVVESCETVWPPALGGTAER